MKQKSKLYDQIREIIALLCNFKMRELLLVPTDNSLLQFFRYCFVGGIATIVDWSVLYITESFGIHYLLGATIGFLCGLASNYAMSKCMVFNANKAKMSAVMEFLAYAVIGIVGLGITLLLMLVLTDWLKIYFMVSKAIVTVLVLMWNYLARRMLYQ